VHDTAIPDNQKRLQAARAKVAPDAVTPKVDDVTPWGGGATAAAEDDGANNKAADGSSKATDPQKVCVSVCLSVCRCVQVSVCVRCVSVVCVCVYVCGDLVEGVLDWS
jgi:hypothetical protein